MSAGGARARLSALAATLGWSLTVWATRDDTGPQPEVRQAANDALDAIDALSRELHAVRARLVSEIRESDDASAARVDALLTARTVRHD